MGSSSSIEKKVQTIKKPEHMPNPDMHYTLADLARRNHMYIEAYNRFFTAMYSFKEEHAYMLEYSCYERMAEMQIHLENYERASEIYFGVGYLGIEIGHTSVNNGTLTMYFNALLCLLAAGQHTAVLLKIKTNCDYPHSSFRANSYGNCIEGFVYCDSFEWYKNSLEDFKPLYSDSEYRTKLVEKITSLQEERFKTCLIDEK